MSNLARLGKIDVRRDQDQNVKLNQIINLLADAGYYRARVKGLSPFDKIVGGMTWCIEVCNFDIEVELLFHDGLSIGQKISLTENIVKVLPSMRCPYAIEPHQIQGLDTVHIFPVVQWLVELALETRVERQDDTLLVALDEYERRFRKVEETDVSNLSHAIRNICLVRSKYSRKRRFRRGEKPCPEEAFSRAVLTLLEYSESTTKPQLPIDSDSEDMDEEEEKIQILLTEDMCQERLPEVNNELTEDEMEEQACVTQETILPCSETQNQISLESRMEMAAEALENRLKKEKGESQSSVSDLENKLKVRTNERASLASELDALKEAEQELSSKLLKTREEHECVASEIENERQRQSISEDETLEELVSLVEANENTKKAISSFKENCREESDKMQEKIRVVKEELNVVDEDVPAALLTTLSSESESLRRRREELAGTSREAESLKRLVDDVPGRAELSQYQKRFVELYDLVDAEHHETLQFYNMYNALSDARSYMKKESDLLNSVLDHLDEALSSPSCLEDYVNQLKKISDGILQNKLKLEKKWADAKSEKSACVVELNRLQDLQMLYAKALLKFSNEVSRNERLHQYLGVEC